MSFLKETNASGEEVSAKRVLIVDDDPKIVLFISTIFKASGYKVQTAADGEEALKQAISEQPQVILLDLGLPHLDGFGVLQRLREWTDTQVIVLSAHGSDQDKVRALDLGADDYITKPFSMEELMARVRLAFRRLQRFHSLSPALAETNPVVHCGDLEIDLASRLVRVSGEEVTLTKTEYELLRLLVTNRDRIMTHRDLLQQIWGPEYGGETEYLRTFMRRLRRKLEKMPGQPKYLLTEPGIGYRFKS